MTIELHALLDEAAAYCVQDAPESTDPHNAPPLMAAASLSPSGDDASAAQLWLPRVPPPETASEALPANGRAQQRQICASKFK